MTDDQFATSVIVGIAAFAVALVQFLAILRTSLSTHRTAKLAEETNRQLERIAKILAERKP